MTQEELLLKRWRDLPTDAQEKVLEFTQLLQEQQAIILNVKDEVQNTKNLSFLVCNEFCTGQYNGVQIVV